MKHYRCFKCFIPATKSERITDTVTFLPHNKIPVPNTTPEEGIKQALQDTYKLMKSKPTNVPYTTMGDKMKEVIKKIQKIFHKPLFDNQIKNKKHEQLSQEFYKKNVPNR